MISTVLCLCGHAIGEHVRRLRAPRDRQQCRLPRCRCVRFTEAPFAEQQLPMFLATLPARQVQFRQRPLRITLGQ